MALRHYDLNLVPVAEQLPHPLQRFLDRLLTVLFLKDIELSELHSGAAGVGFGGWMIVPYLFPQYHWPLIITNPAFRAMAEAGPQWVWACLYLSVGLFVLGFLLLDHHYGRIFATLLATALWIFLAVMIARAGLLSTGVPIYGLLSAVSALSFWRNCARPRATGR